MSQTSLDYHFLYEYDSTVALFLRSHSKHLPFLLGYYRERMWKIKRWSQYQVRCRSVFLETNS